MSLTLAQTEHLYEASHLALEQRELCGPDFLAALADAVEADGGDPHPDWWKLAKAPLGASRGLPGGGEVLKDIKGMGRVYDWRESSWTPSNGGRIDVRLFVQHIPVVRNVDGIADMVTLRNVLVAQGLMVQSCTDREGNVGLFTPFDSLCYQAKGANQFSTGCEHMHLSTSEDWSKQQLRAMAWLIQLCERKHDVKRTRGRLAGGGGIARVLEEGQVWHSEVSAAAGFNDRSDPWGNTPHDVVVERWEYVQHCIGFFEDNGHFDGA
jgi:N-acetylmuramoyl-L-alanine amidase